MQLNKEQPGNQMQLNKEQLDNPRMHGLNEDGSHGFYAHDDPRFNTDLFTKFREDSIDDIGFFGKLKQRCTFSVRVTSIFSTPRLSFW